MIIELKDKKIEESLKHLRKAIEIVGGNKYLENIYINLPDCYQH